MRLRRVWLGALFLLASCGIAKPSGGIELPGARAFPESITSTADGTLYVGRLAEGGVVRIRPGETPEVWIKPGDGGTRSVFGVLADESGHRLWLCSNDSTALGVPGPSTVGGSWLKAFDLSSGALVASVALPGARTFCNDIAIGPDGAAYVTNSLAPEVLRLAPGSDRLEVWASDPRFAPPAAGGAGLDGLAFDAKGDLVVDLFGKGELYVVAAGAPHAVRPLAASRTLSLPDAIRPAGDGTFLLIEGGGRLDRLTVTGGKADIEVLQAGFAGPTGVTKVGDKAFVSEGRLSQLRRSGALEPFRVYPVPLPETARH